MNNQHLVLVGANGKQASRKDAWILAHQMWAEQETAAGRGGGIIGLLLPKNLVEQRKLNDAKKKYQFKFVKRRGNQSRKSARDIVLYDTELIVKIAHLYEQQFGHLPKSIRIKKIANWVAKNLRNHKSQLYAIVESRSWILEERQSPGWWEKMFAERRKQRKNSTGT